VAAAARVVEVELTPTSTDGSKHHSSCAPAPPWIRPPLIDSTPRLQCIEDLLEDLIDPLHHGGECIMLGVQGLVDFYISCRIFVNLRIGAS
jgi:hypothetical protein